MSMPDRDRGVLFDLDGTLADTAPDMTLALNQVLRANGRSALPSETVRPHVSHGAKALIRLGFRLNPGDAGYDRLRQDFLDAYRAHIDVHTRLFPGIADLLDTLDSWRVPWGIVTNKPAWLTDPLLSSLDIGDRAGCVVSGDTTPFAKPHPEPIHYACRQIRRPEYGCWYVGDAARDIQAGRAAGTRTLIALFGYLGEDDTPESWGADGMVSSPLDMLGWLGG
jgi:phosphoglycolate phosphatase